MIIDIFEEMPLSFEPRIDVAGCYVQVNGKILLLQRSIRQSQSGTWGLPGGKLEKGETHEQAALRELFEETHIALSPQQIVSPMKPFFIRTQELSYTFHVFYMPLAQMPNLLLSPEHAAYAWTSVQEALQWPLMAGAKEVLLSCRTAFDHL